MADPPHIEGVPEGEPFAIQDDLFNSDKDTTRSHHSTLNQDDVNLLSQLLLVPTEDRKRQYDKDLPNEVAKKMTIDLTTWKEAQSSQKCQKQTKKYYPHTTG